MQAQPNNIRTKKFIFTICVAMLLVIAVKAQNTTLEFQPGKLAVLRGGNGVFTFTDRRWPVYIDEFDPVVSNSVPLLTVPIPTNGANCMFFNLHGGSEGEFVSRSYDRQYLVVTGYHTNGINLGPLTSTPSSAGDVDRGFETFDAFTNTVFEYDSQDWFGMQPGVTQNNPRGIATDGTNSYWGDGTVAGTSTGFEESGTLFYNQNVSGTPEQVQNQVQSGYELRIVNGVLYSVIKQESGGGLVNGIVDFEDINNDLVPLPWAPGQEQITVFTNLVLNFGSVNGTQVASVLAFDMNPAGTIVYAADEALGIVKYTYSDGAWSQPYVFSPTNLGTLWTKGNQGCFGIAVDFSQTNPIIYATTCEEGDGANICSNRLISIVDTNNPGTNMVANTLAVAPGPLYGFRGLDFTPDLRPEIHSQPQPIDTTTNAFASFSVGVQSVYTANYQWQEVGTSVTNIANSANISGATSATLAFAHASLTNQGNYQLVVTNAYGAVTSSIVNMTVTATVAPPLYTNALLKLTNYIGDTVTIAATPIYGTPPFNYQWFNGTIALSDGPDGNGSGYIGSQSSSTLVITNAQLTDSGNYYLGVTNSASGTNIEIASLVVEVRPPTIPAGGQPISFATLVGQTGQLSVSSDVGTPPLTYSWYQGNTAPVTLLSTMNEFTVSSNVLTIGPAVLADTTNYFCVVANSAGSVTSQVASVTVIVTPAASYVGYSNQVYTQNFDSLPNPGTTTVNTVGGGGPTTIGGITYDISNPFDFAFPIFFTNQPLDGLGLSNTMSGWYGECDADTDAGQLGATAGDQTTGGILSFGPTNNLVVAGNRALGLIATSTSGETHFGLKLINRSSGNLNYFNLSFVGELWKQGTRPKEMVFGYTINSAGTNSQFLAGGVIANATNNLYNGLDFGSNVWAPTSVMGVDGTQPQNQTNMSVTNLALNGIWAPGQALWLVWSIDDAGGSGQGFGIDNLSFSASVNPVYAPGALGSVNYIPNGANKGLNFSFNGPAGSATSYTVWSTTNLLTPLNQWKNLGNPTSESPAGTYNVIDPSATANPDTFYRVTSP
jgi:hypothetical protein